MEDTDIPVTFRVAGAPVERAKAREWLDGLTQDDPDVEIYSLHTQRSGLKPAELQARPGVDVVVLKVASGPALVLHPDSARQLLASGAPAVRAGDDAPVVVSAELPWNHEAAATRSGEAWAHGTVLEWFGIVRARQVAGKLGADWIRQRADGAATPGLYRLQREALPERFDAADRITSGAQTGIDITTPVLILIHGTFVNTASTFGKLWPETHAEVKSHAEVNGIFDAYRNQVYALDHRTLGASPIENALDLVDVLPEGVRIHLLTHSRGGLVAEVLVRAASEPLSEQGLGRFFADPALDTQRRQLLDLARQIRDKRLTFERVVRVACPARGTLLASRRLDAYLSVIQWLLRKAGGLVLGELMAVLQAIARERTQITEFPGLQAMMPDSALIRWLNAPIAPVDSELYVVAGNNEAGGLWSWIKTLVADAFFWTDNDLVVQTRSMYGGVQRKASTTAARFVLAAEAAVSHFTYFSFKDTVDAVKHALDALPAPERNPAWTPIGQLSWLGEDAGGVRELARPSVVAPQRHRPSVIVVPGFLGSHLAGGEGRLWLTHDSVTGFGRLAGQRDGRQRDWPKTDKLPPLKAEALVERWYGQLCARLAETHDVIPFPYDWRQPIESEADGLAACMQDWLNRRTRGQGPLRVLAHGMGGLLVRAVHAHHHGIWENAMAFDGARVVMLGVPHEGSWTPLQVLCGADGLADRLSAGAPLFGEQDARIALARMPGFIQMQACMLDPVHELDLKDGWDRLLDEVRQQIDRQTRWHEPLAWAAPAQAMLTRARLFWNTLRKHEPDFIAEANKFAIVVGSAASTPDQLVVQGGEISLRSTSRGDGRVTHDSACLQQHRVWRIDAEHRAMPAASAAFSGLVELLNEGQTRLLEQVDAPLTHPAHAASAAVDKAAPDATLQPLHQATPRARPHDIDDVFAVEPPAQPGRLTGKHLHVRVYHGDLRFTRLPLLIGHYQSLSLTGSEAVVDSLVQQRMSKALRAGIYPDKAGEYQVFENVRRVEFTRRQKQRFVPRPSAVIVVGLGEEGKLNPQRLAYTIRTGILAYAQRLAEGPNGNEPFAIAATLVGSGGAGISVGDATLALIQGIHDANIKIADANANPLHKQSGPGWPIVSSLSIVEVYLDRAADAWRVLKLHAQSNPTLSVEDRLEEGEGRLRRPLDSSYRGANYDFISVLRPKAAGDAEPQISYSLDTRRARTEVRAQHAQGPLIRDLVEKASNSTVADPLIGRTLFNLLVPVIIEPYLAGSNDIVMELDLETAALPWELLDADADTGASSAGKPEVPWAIRSKMIRKLQVERFRGQVVDAADEDNVLIVGEPLVENGYARLPGAQREAHAIAKVARATLATGGDRVTLLADQNDAHTIINQLFARNYRLVHIAGHGRAGRQGGVVLSGGHTFLGPNEIEAMRVTPELVFVNCCHLGLRDTAPIYDRTHFAASMAEALIGIGVRCVIAAGWAVEDGPAERFAATFYNAIFSGARFIDAVGQARRGAWEANRNGNTWAAYQCYGDPDWSWRNEATAQMPSPNEEYASVASPSSLKLVLETIATEALYTPQENCERHRQRLAYLERRFDKWEKHGSIAEAFGTAYAALFDRDKALAWYRKARDATDGGATLVALELYAEQLSLPLSVPASGRLAPAATLSDRLKELDASITILTNMLELLQHTRRRHALLGHAYKRKSMLLAQSDYRDKDASDALELARRSFAAACRLPHEGKYDFYPPRAVLMCELRQVLLAQRERPGGDWKATEIADAMRMIDQAVHDEPNFFSIVAQSEIDIFKAILRGDLRHARSDIDRALEDLSRRINARRFWIYVYDDANFLLEPYAVLALDHGELEEAEAAAGLLQMLAHYCGAAPAPKPKPVSV